MRQGGTGWDKVGQDGAGWGVGVAGWDRVGQGGSSGARWVQWGRVGQGGVGWVQCGRVQIKPRSKIEAIPLGSWTPRSLGSLGHQDSEFLTRKICVGAE